MAVEPNKTIDATQLPPSGQLSQTFKQTAHPPASQTLVQKLDINTPPPNNAAMHTSNDRVSSHASASGAQAQQSMGKAAGAKESLGRSIGALEKGLDQAKRQANQAVGQAATEQGQSAYATQSAMASSSMDSMSLAADLVVSSETYQIIAMAVDALYDRGKPSHKAISKTADMAAQKLRSQQSDQPTSGSSGANFESVTGQDVQDLLADKGLEQQEMKQMKIDMHSLDETQDNAALASAQIDSGQIFDEDLSADGVYDLADLSITGKFEGASNFPAGAVDLASAAFNREAELQSASRNDLTQNLNVGMSA